MKYYTLKEAAELTGYNKVHIYHLCKRLEVSHSRQGRRVVFSETELADLKSRKCPEIKHFDARPKQ